MFVLQIFGGVLILNCNGNYVFMGQSVMSSWDHFLDVVPDTAVIALTFNPKLKVSVI